MDKYATTAATTRYNGALALLRRSYASAMEAGHVGINALRIVTLQQAQADHAGRHGTNSVAALAAPCGSLRH